MFERKEQSEKRLQDMFGEFIAKFIKRLQKRSLSTREFQKRLVNVAYWSDSKIDKYFKKFIRDTLVTERDIEEATHDLIFATVSLLTNDVDRVYERISMPTARSFFYKVIKYSAKKVYTDPLAHSKQMRHEINEAIRDSIQKHIPLHDILDLFEKQYAEKAECASSSSSGSRPESTSEDNPTALHVEKEGSTSLELEKLSSLALSPRRSVKPESSSSSSESEHVKQIRIPKSSVARAKPYKHKLSNSKGNDLDAPFFSDDSH